MTGATTARAPPAAVRRQRGDQQRGAHVNSHDVNRITTGAFTQAESWTENMQRAVRGGPPTNLATPQLSCHNALQVRFAFFADPLHTSIHCCWSCCVKAALHVNLTSGTSSGEAGFFAPQNHSEQARNEDQLICLLANFHCKSQKLSSFNVLDCLSTQFYHNGCPSSRCALLALLPCILLPLKTLPADAFRSCCFDTSAHHCLRSCSSSTNPRQCAAPVFARERGEARR